MATMLFAKRTSKRVQAIFGSIKLRTVIGGDPGDEPGRVVAEQIDLVHPAPSRTARSLVFLWARFTGIPFEKSALESLIKALQDQKPSFNKRKKNVVRRGRKRGTKKAFAKYVGGLYGKVSREKIYDLSWTEFHHHPKPKPNSPLWGEHKKRVDDTTYNLTRRRARPKTFRKNSPRK
jgi:hypothetical protein